MSKYTKGPWKVESEFIETANGSLALAEIVPVDMDGNWCIGETSKANARLMAAAPELLAALESLVGAASEFCGCHLDVSLMNARKALSAAREEA